MNLYTFRKYWLLSESKQICFCTPCMFFFIYFWRINWNHENLWFHVLNVSFQVFKMAVILEKIYLGDFGGNRSVPCWQMEKKRSWENYLDDVGGNGSVSCWWMEKKRSCILMFKYKFLFTVLLGKQLQSHHFFILTWYLGTILLYQGYYYCFSCILNEGIFAFHIW